MTISQVLKFCEKKELSITRAMIQNYIRAGLIPPPIEKRLYTHKHLAALALIDRLKTVFDIPTIQGALAPYIDDEGLSPETYAALMQKTEALTREWLAQTHGDTLLLMSCAASLKTEGFS
jgi:DNA-binding transcriptional MerR regulator